MISTPKRSEQYDDIGNSYISEKDNFFSQISDPGKEAILDFLRGQKDKEGVDVGCGGGQDTKAYLNTEIKSIIGVDPSDVMVKEAQRLLGSDGALLGSWTDLPFSDDSKDFLIGRFSLHYVEDVSAAYKEGARVLRRKGKLIMILPDPKADPVVIEGGKEMVKTPIFGGKVIVTYPRHRKDEYFSDTFNNLFKLINEEAYASPERNLGFTDTLIVIAEKR
ncbi:MAG: class I SAM-dependent methyltransferase [Candidatus Paceibacterota bacterium]|jgi:ubiquinone/menaquinone biosynthesis C-methylase UbiE